MPAAREDGPSVRSILRIVATIVVCAIALYLVYRVREPLGWMALATFLAVVLSAPVNVLSRRMPRGLAIALVYFAVVLVPIGMALVLVPPAVNQIVTLVNNMPEYVDDLNRAFDENPQLRQLDDDYDITGKLDQLASDLVDRLGEAASALADIGAGVVDSIFTLVTILVLSLFMVGRGRQWTDAFLARRPHREEQALRRTLDGMATAVSSYVGGALAQATVAGIAAFIMLTVLGVPSPLPLALIIALLDLIPLVGATLGAVIVGAVTLFTDFPTVTIIWAIFAIAYQQFENYVVQPRIQSRAVSLDPFIVVIAALFGGALLGVIGALLAIPIAAVIQIAVKEALQYRQQLRAGPTPGRPPAGA
jgi:predicted PurR-regulated permease PerM